MDKAIDKDEIDFENADMLSALMKLAGEDQIAQLGVSNLVNGEHNWGVLKRTATLLRNARTPDALGAVDSGLQATMHKVFNLNKMNSPSMNNNKTSLYAYTLQNLTFNLKNWQLPDECENNYEPKILRIYREATELVDALKLNPEILDACYSPRYQIKGVRVLDEWEFLDEGALESMVCKLKILKERYKHKNSLTKLKHPVIGGRTADTETAPEI